MTNIIISFVLLIVRPNFRIIQMEGRKVEKLHAYFYVVLKDILFIRLKKHQPLNGQLR